MVLVCGVSSFSLLFGNLYVYFAFGGEPIIEENTRFVLFAILTGAAVAGTLCLILLRKPPEVADLNVQG